MSGEKRGGWRVGERERKKEREGEREREREQIYIKYFVPYQGRQGDHGAGCWM